MTYPNHETFIAPARAAPEVWRLLLGLVIVAVLYASVILWIFGILVLTNGLDGAQARMAEMMAVGTPTSTFLILATFIGMAIGPLAAAEIAHGRSLWSVFGPRRRLIRDFAIATAICGVLYGVRLLVPTEMPPSANLDLSLWTLLLPLALLGVLIQTGAEEVLFRGYLQQQLAARFRSLWVWMILPSAVFAVLHFNPNQFGENAWLVVAAVFLFAVLAADLTAKTGSLGAAWGFHFANNTVAILFVSMEGPLSGLALYTVPADVLEGIDLRPVLLGDMISTLVTWAIIRFGVTR